MKKLPLLSICVAAYNVEEYIEECLNSIRDIEKGYGNKEIIIVNDCSKDNTEEVIKKWISENKNIKIIYSKNEKNSGCSGTYYKASQLANGKYITFLDADDFLIKESFCQKVKMLEDNHKLKVVYGNCFIYTEKEGFISNFQGDLKLRFSGEIEKIKIMLYTNNPRCSISTSVIDLDFFRKIGGFDPNIQINDWVLNIKIFENIKDINEITVYDEPCFAYRRTNDNMTNNIPNILKEQKKVIENYSLPQYKNVGLSNIYYEAGLIYLSQNQLKNAFLMLRKSYNAEFSMKRMIVFLVYLVVPMKLVKRIPGGIKKKVFKFLGI